jgi:hypothetical protein
MQVEIQPAFLKAEPRSSANVFSLSTPQKKLKNSFLISFKKFHVTRLNRAGSNKIYEINRLKSFFFELADQPQSTNNIHLKIYTNDYHIKSTPISYNSTSLLPNIKFQVSTMLTHFFSHQYVIPRRIQQKYFQLIRSKLLDRIDMIKSRGNNTQR